MKKHTPLLFTLLTASLLSVAQVNFESANNNLFVADFDNDGLVDDLGAFVSENGKSELILWSSDNVSYNELESLITYPKSINNHTQVSGKVVTGDFDNDGFIDDLALIHEVGLNKTDITVWINTNGTFVPKTWWHGADFDANQVTNAIVVGDFDNDGFVDDIAAFYDYEQKRTKVFVWKSTGEQFKWPGTWWIGNDFNASKVQQSTVVGDFDHDGFVDDIASLYNYDDDFCKIFVWTKDKDKFNWPSTWYSKDDFKVSNATGNIIAGDYNNNGFSDNIATLYRDGNEMSHIKVWERGKSGFNEPSNWWYGTNEGSSIQNRLVTLDFDGNNTANQISGIYIDQSEVEILTWTAQDNSFYLPSSSWAGTTSVEDCELNGGCLPNHLQSQFNAYPNPSSGDFSIDIPNITTEAITISVYNVLGSRIDQRTVYAGDFVNYSLNNLNSGNYTVKISCNDFYYHQKLIIQ